MKTEKETIKIKVVKVKYDQKTIGDDDGIVNYLGALYNETDWEEVSVDDYSKLLNNINILNHLDKEHQTIIYSYDRQFKGKNTNVNFYLDQIDEELIKINKKKESEEIKRKKRLEREKKKRDDAKVKKLLKSHTKTEEEEKLLLKKLLEKHFEAISQLE